MTLNNRAHIVISNQNNRLDKSVENDPIKVKPDGFKF